MGGDLRARRRSFAWPLMGIVGAVLLLAGFSLQRASAQTPPCDVPGWFPADFGIKDHAVFTFEGRYYLAGIDTTDNTHFAYGVSEDLCTWTTLDPILAQRPPLPWDERLVWAPDVWQEDGTYYMFYTSVGPTITQRIALATSTAPDDPASWQVDTSFVLTPTHPGAVWSAGTWADCRDPHVFRLDGLYYLLYAGRDTDGGIIGLATASALTGPWRDFGSILTLPGGLPESPTILQANGGFYLIYNRAGDGEAGGEKYRFGPAPGGPWGDENSLTPGWAHEIWKGLDGKIYASYLTNYTVTIRPLLWNTRYAPPRPFLGWQIVEVFLPLTLR